MFSISNQYKQELNNFTLSEFQWKTILTYLDNKFINFDIDILLDQYGLTFLIKKLNIEIIFEVSYMQDIIEENYLNNAYNITDY